MATVDRREYLTATTLDQDFLDRSQDNLENELNLICDIETPDGSINASDRNLYVGSTFYEALATIPVVTRSLGDWLAPEIEFSKANVSVSNVDERFNKYLPSGANFGGWIGKSLTIKLGLRDVSATYSTIFSGQITDIGGLQRDRQKITFSARDKFDRVSVSFPNEALTTDAFPDLESSLVGTIVPVIYGDWTSASTLDALGASVPSYPVNGANAGVLAFTTSVRSIIAAHALISVDTTQVYLKRSDKSWLMNSADVSIVSGSDNKLIDVKQSGNGGVTTLLDEESGNTNPYEFQTGDVFIVRCKGKELGSYDDNIVEQARDILKTYGGLSSGDFDSTWNTFRDKSTPTESAVANFKSRVWIQNPETAIRYALSMLEQVRLEIFVNRDLKFSLNSLHLDNFVASPSYTVENWDVIDGTLSPKLDDKNIWNRAKADFNFDPLINENSRSTPIFKNIEAINQAGKAISKIVVFPNLYIESDVSYNLKEMLKLSSSYPEFIDVTLTSRAMLKDLGDFVKVNLDFAGAKYNNVPMMIRQIGYDPEGVKIPVKLWSMQMTPFSGWDPDYEGITGGSTATITQE